MIKVKIIIFCILTLLVFTSCSGQTASPNINTPDAQIIEDSDKTNSYYDIIKPDIDWVMLSQVEKLVKAQQIIEIEKKEPRNL